MASNDDIAKLIAALDLLAVFGAKISKQGLGVQDLPALVDLIQKNQVLIDGFNAAKAIPGDLKTISGADVVVLVEGIIQIVNDVKAQLAAA